MKFKSEFLYEIKKRGFIYQDIEIENLDSILSKNKIYNGEKNIKAYTQFHKKLIRELFS